MKLALQLLVGGSALLALLPPPAAAAPAAAGTAPAAPAEATSPPATRIHKRQVELERLAEAPRKRPFCNAFTGCGRKRADESLGALVQLGEPAAAELSRQILSEAKLWDALQAARQELLRQRQRSQAEAPRVGGAGEQLALPLPLTGFRRRRAAPAAPASQESAQLLR